MPRVIGAGRMFDNDRAVLVMLDRRPSDDELRALHQFLCSFGWTPPALEDSIETSEREAVEPARAIAEQAALRLIDQLQPGAELDAPHGRDGDGVALVTCSRPRCVPHRPGRHCARCDS